jgi:uncharacterized protein YbjT (DUF2867 family)
MERRHAGDTVLVTGATGRQGGAVARRLLKRGFRVRALTRDPEKPEAVALAGLGAEVVRGDMDDPATLGGTVRGSRGVFSVQNFWESGYDGEIRQGKALVDAARGAGVSHFVQSSVGGAERESGVPHFECKREVEQHLLASGLPHTVLRPAAFMDDWEEMREEILSGLLAQPLPPQTRLQQVAVEDIGAFAALAFERPGAWIGREAELAGDGLTMEEMAGTFARVTGRPVRYEQVPLEEFRREFGGELAAMYEWFERYGYEADVAALRREHPGLLTLEGYLRKNGWAGAGASEGALREDARRRARKEGAR